MEQKVPHFPQFTAEEVLKDSKLEESSIKTSLNTQSKDNHPDFSNSINEEEIFLSGFNFENDYLLGFNFEDNFFPFPSEDDPIAPDSTSLYFQHLNPYRVSMVDY